MIWRDVRMGRLVPRCAPPPPLVLGVCLVPTHLSVVRLAWPLSSAARTFQAAKSKVQWQSERLQHKGKKQGSRH
jgi:hypothetical protein